MLKYLGFQGSSVIKKKKCLPMQETWVQSLGQEDPWRKKELATPLQYSCLENPMDRGVK